MPSINFAFFVISNFNCFMSISNIFEIDIKQLKLDITKKAKFIDGIIYK